MSQASAAKSVRDKGNPMPMEQRLFHVSPLGGLATTTALFAVLFGSYLLIATLEHMPLWQITNGVIALQSGVWPAFVLSLLCCTALGVQRFVRGKEQADVKDFAKILKGGPKTAELMGRWAPHNANLKRGTAAGIVLGLFFGVSILISETDSGSFRSHISTTVWFIVVITLLMVSFARGVEMSRKAGANFKRTMENDLIIDLLRIENLAVLGRSAARASLIWFAVSAVVCLFFIGGGLDWFTLILLAACAAMGLWVFISITHRVHTRIHAAKSAELERTRQEIEKTRGKIDTDPGAGARLQGLLAYEARIADVREWPFDQSTAVRLGAYVLIPAIPWFGQAAAQYFVEHFVRLPG